MLPKNEWVSKHFKDTYAFSFVNPDSMKNTPKEMKEAKKESKYYTITFFHLNNGKIID